MQTDYEKRQKRGYNIYQAKEFAQKIIISMNKNFKSNELEILYKDMVRRIFKWNEELDEELIKDEKNKTTEN